MSYGRYIKVGRATTTYCTRSLSEIIQGLPAADEKNVLN